LLLGVGSGPFKKMAKIETQEVSGRKLTRRVYVRRQPLVKIFRVVSAQILLW
jgi:hypothetical protein